MRVNSTGVMVNETVRCTNGDAMCVTLQSLPHSLSKRKGRLRGLM